MSSDPLPLQPLLSLHSKIARTLSEALDDPVERFNPKIIDCAIKFLDNNGVDLTINPKDDPQKAKEETLDTLKLLAERFREEDIADVA